MRGRRERIRRRLGHVGAVLWSGTTIAAGSEALPHFPFVSTDYVQFLFFNFATVGHGCWGSTLWIDGAADSLIVVVMRILSLKHNSMMQFLFQLGPSDQVTWFDLMTK